LYSPITVRPIPSDRAITRALAPQAYLRRRTSRTFRIDNLSPGIGPSLCSNRKGMTLPRSDCRQRSPIYPINRVAAFVRNRWPLSVGLGGRFASDSAREARILTARNWRNSTRTSNVQSINQYISRELLRQAAALDRLNTQALPELYDEISGGLGSLFRRGIGVFLPLLLRQDPIGSLAQAESLGHHHLIDGVRDSGEAEMPV
jgi:hypothetical protein